MQEPKGYYIIFYRRLFCALFVLLPGLLFSQQAPQLFDTTAVETTLQAELRKDGSDTVDIYYQLLDGDDTYDTISVYFRNGQSGAWDTLTNIAGDSGVVPASDSSVHRQIRWHAASQLGTSFESDSVQLMIIAKDGLSLLDTLVMDTADLVIDTKVPTASSLSPADGSTGVAADTKLGIVFSEKVYVDDGYVRIKKIFDSTIVDSIHVDSTNVTGSGTDTIDIVLNNQLDPGVAYFVQVDSLAFRDSFGNPYAGINDDYSWNFVGGFFSEVSNITDSLTQAFSNHVAWADYDNDGDLDILLTGSDLSSNTITEIYRNDAGIFTNIQAGLSGVLSNAVDWGDYDNDNDLDLLIAGSSDGVNKISKIYRNDAGSFTDIAAGLPGVSGAPTASWGDYDNDGDLDILLVGKDTESVLIGKVYNNNNGIFSDISAGLTGLENGDGAWGDYDNDGDLDILITGWDGSAPRSIIYRNDNGAFTDIYASLTDIYYGAAAWGDYDADGDLDILLVGGILGGRIGTIFRNDNGTFTDIAAGLAQLYRSTVAWGDYDNDGDLDAIVSGVDGSLNKINKLYRNDAGTFVDINAGLPGVEYGSIAWGDYDNDGDLDLLISGRDENNNNISKVFKNNSSVSNTAPTTVEGLSSTVDADSVTLGWVRSTDTQTADIALFYNIRIGTITDGVNIMSPMSDVSTGYHKKPGMGNAFQDTSWTIHNLAPGTYYWSVQAIDHGYTPSPFSSFQTFTIEGDITPPDNDMTLTATALDTNMVTLSWDPSAIDSTDADSVGIWYRTDGVFPVSYDDASAILAGKYVLADSLDTLSGLTPGGLYHFSLFVRDSSGNWSDSAASAQDDETLPTPGIKLWTNLTGDNLWTSAGNWFPSRTPASSDTVFFLPPQNVVCSLLVNDTVSGIVLDSAWAGSFILGTGVELVTTNGVYVKSGTCDLSAGRLRNSGYFIISGGTFFAPADTMFISGDLTQVGGTFTHSSGTVIFDNTSPVQVSIGNNLYNMGMTGSDVTAVNQDLTVYVLCIASGTFSLSGIHYFSQTETRIEGGTFLCASDSIIIGQDLILSSGTFRAPDADGEMRLGRGWQQTGGVFQHNNGTATFNGTATGVAIHMPDTAFHRVLFNGPIGAWAFDTTFQADTLQMDSGFIHLSSGSNHYVGDVIINGGHFNFGGTTLYISRNADFSGADSLSNQDGGHLVFNGAGNQILIPHPTDSLAHITHDGTAATLQLSTNSLITAAFSHLSGRIDFNGFDIRTMENGFLDFYNGDSLTMINLAGRTLTSGGRIVLSGQSGNLLNTNPATTWYIDAADSLLAYYAVIGNSNADSSFIGIADSSCVDSGSNSNWIFAAVDTTAPAILTLTPPDDITGVLFDANLSLVFNEYVLADNGFIRIKKVAGSVVTDSIHVDSSNITGFGTNTITIDPANLLDPGVAYFVQIDSTAFMDSAGNHYAGIYDETTWNFYAFEDTTPPDNDITLTATALTLDTIQLTWNPSAIDSSDADSIGIWWDTLGLVDSAQSPGAIGFIKVPHTDSVSMLTVPSTKTVYYFSLFVRDSAGNWSNTNTTTQDSSKFLEDGLVAYYPFTDNADDNSGYNRNGTVNGATLSLDRFGTPNRAYNFESDDYISTVPSNELIPGNSGITLCAWFKTSILYSTSADLDIGGRLFSLYKDSFEASKFALGFYGDNTSTLMALYDNESQLRLNKTNSGFNDNSWHFLVSTYDSITNKLTIYYDGSNVATITTGSLVTTGTSVANIGIWNTSTVQGGFSGKIDDIRIYNRALSPLEIDALYKDNGWGTFSPELFDIIGGTSVLKAEQRTDESDTVSIWYKLLDPDNATDSITAFYRNGLSDAWTALTNFSGDAGDVDATDSSKTRTINWHAASQMGSYFDSDSVQIMVIAVDAEGHADTLTMPEANLIIDTEYPYVDVMVHFVYPPHGDSAAITIDGTFTEKRPNANIYSYMLNGAAPVDSVVGFGTSNPAPLTWQLALNGDDSLYVFLTHVDTMGHVMTSASNIAYVIPKTPDAPVLNAPGITSINVAIDSNDNAGVGLPYAIQIAPDVGGKSWVQNDGSLDTAASWQTIAGWSTTTISGLNEKTSYSVVTISRSPYDSTLKSSFSPASGLSTLSDSTPPDNDLTLTATAIAGEQIIVSWNPSAIDSTDADSIIVRFRTDHYPDSAFDPDAMYGGMFALADSVNTLSGFGGNTKYYFSIFVRDSSGNFSAWSESASDSTHTDIYGPMVSGTNPPNNALGVSFDSELRIQFGEPVWLTSGNVEIRRASDSLLTEIIDLGSGAVTGSGTDSIRINPDSTLLSNTKYYVLIEPSAFRDDYGHNFAGITEVGVWSFTSIEVLGPVIYSTHPTDNAIGIDLDDSLVITFHKPVKFGTGNISLFEKNGDKLFKRISVTSDRVSGTGTSVITLKHDSIFTSETEYYIIIDSSAFLDIDNVP
ncbi:MAG: Ig-like domain-containing protein, partial [Fibrobacteria bacterium]|nr:Ig-like domain-containing protein [Fibrobacteria bacterium]